MINNNVDRKDTMNTVAPMISSFFLKINQLTNRID